MKLSMNILCEELGSQFQIEHPAAECMSEMRLSGASLLTNSPPQQDLVYLVESRRLPVRWKHTGQSSLIVVGKADPAYFQGTDVSYFTIDDNRFPLVMNAVLDVFRKYDALDNGLRDSILQGQSPETICDRVARELDSPVVVFDEASRIRFLSRDAEALLNWETDSFTGMRLVPTDFLNDISLVYTETKENASGSTVLLQDDRLPYNIITNLGGTNGLNLLVFESRRKLTRGMLQLASYLNRYIALAFENSGKQDVHGGLATLISSMLDGKKYSSTELVNQLASVNWKVNDTCCCIVVYAPKNKQGAKYINNICLKLENQLKACVAFPYHGHAVAVVNLNKTDFNIQHIPNRIGILLREGLLKAVISFTYWNFETTPIYYQQACSAYDIGTLYSPSHWCYLFEDHALSYFMHYGSSRLPPRHLCHPALVHLYRYDLENGTDLLKTLEAYVGNNCNAVTAASKLFIHRNTFYQRLNKIQDMLNLDLENQDVRLYLQLSTHLISMYYYELENEFRFPYE